MDLETLLTEPFDAALHSIKRKYSSAGEVWKNREAILNMRPVKEFLEDLDQYRNAGDQLVSDTIAWHLINFFQKEEPAEVRHIYEITAACFNHDSPITVAKAYLHQRDVMVYESLDNALAEHNFKHSDLVYSHHNENIEQGRIMCHSCGQPAELTLNSKVHELVATEIDKKDAEEKIISDIATALQISRRKLTKELNNGLLVGTQYRNVYSALEQTRFYAVILADMIRNSNLGTSSILRKLSDSDCMQDIEAIVAEHIRPPILVVQTRIKGQSFADKILLHHHSALLNKGLEDGTLQNYLKSQGSTPRKFYAYSPSDLIGIMAIVHGNAASYDLRTGNYERPKEEDAAQEKVYDLIANMLGMSIEQFKKLDPKKRHFIHHRSLEVVEIKDYIKEPKDTGYMACHLILESNYLGYPIRFELQAKTNFMDTLAELTDKQNHDNRKNEQIVLRKYLEQEITPLHVAIYHLLLSPQQKYRYASQQS